MADQRAPASGRAPTNRCGARSRPACAAPPSALRPPPPPPPPPPPAPASAPPARVWHSESRSGSGGCSLRRTGPGPPTSSPGGREGARRTHPPSAPAAAADPPPWPAEKPRRRAAGRNSSGTRRRRSFWAGPVAVGVSTGSAALYPPQRLVCPGDASRRRLCGLLRKPRAAQGGAGSVAGAARVVPAWAECGAPGMGAGARRAEGYVDCHGLPLVVCSLSEHRLSPSLPGMVTLRETRFVSPCSHVPSPKK